MSFIPSCNLVILFASHILATSQNDSASTDSDKYLPLTTHEVYPQKLSTTTFAKNKHITKQIENPAHQMYNFCLILRPLEDEHMH